MIKAPPPSNPHGKTDMPSLVISRGFVARVGLHGLLDEVVALVLKLLPHPHLPRVQTLPIMAVYGLRRWGPGKMGRRGGSKTRSTRGNQQRDSR